MRPEQIYRKKELEEQMDTLRKEYLMGEGREISELKGRLKSEGFALPSLLEERLFQTGDQDTFRRSQSDSKKPVYFLMEEDTLYVGVPDGKDRCWDCDDSAHYIKAHLSLTDGQAVRDRDVQLVLEAHVDSGLERLSIEEREELFDKKEGRDFKLGSCRDDYVTLAAMMVRQYGAKSVTVAFRDKYAAEFEERKRKWDPLFSEWRKLHELEESEKT
jgi:hypothetical protein